MAKQEPLFTNCPQAEQFLSFTWQACIRSWLECVQQRSGSLRSRKFFRSILGTFFQLFPKNPSEVTRADVSTFMGHPNMGTFHHGQPPAAGTRNTRRAVVSSLFSFAARYPRADGKALFDGINPASNIRPSKPPRVHRTLSPDEVSRLFAAIDAAATQSSRPSMALKAIRDKSIFIALLVTSRRIGELCALRWGDLSHTTLVNVRSGETRDGWQFRFRQKGSSAVEEYSEWPGVVHMALLSYLEKSGRLATIQDSDPLWISTYYYPADPLVPLSGCAVIRALKIYCKAAGINPAKVVVHSFRHTSAATRARGGEDIFSISKALGHKSIATTQLYLEGLVSNYDKGSDLIVQAFPFLAATH